MALPKFNTAIQELRNLMDRWASLLDPVLANPRTDSLILEGVPLKAGRNDIAHKLGRKLQGWEIVRQRGPSSFYDAQDQNSNPHLTLTLYSTQNVVVNLAVF